MEVASLVSDVQHNPEVPPPAAAPADAGGPVGVPPAAAELPRYDFRRPHRPAATAAAMEDLDRNFARELSDRLSEQLGARVEVAFAFAESRPYGDFIHSLSETSCLAVLRADPPGANFCCDLSLDIVYRMIGRLLRDGGGAGSVPPTRPLTQIERALVLPLIEGVAKSLAAAWTTAGPVAVREESLESSPATVRVMPADEQVTAARFQVHFGSSSGRLSLCLPGPVTEFLCDPNAAPPPLPTRSQREAQRQDVTRNLLDAAVELRAVLAETRLRLSDVLTLHEGDIITTNRAAASAEVPIEVQAREKFAGQLGQYGGNRAVAITRLPGEPADGQTQPQPQSQTERGRSS